VKAKQPWLHHRQTPPADECFPVAPSSAAPDRSTGHTHPAPPGPSQPDQDLTTKPDDIVIGPEGIKTSNFYDEERTLPRSVLLLQGHDPAFTPFASLWDSGATNSILSPSAARRLGYNVPEHPEGHGTMKVANGASAKIYWWTQGIRVRPSEHLRTSDGGFWQRVEPTILRTTTRSHKGRGRTDTTGDGQGPRCP